MAMERKQQMQNRTHLHPAGVASPKCSKGSTVQFESNSNVNIVFLAKTSAGFLMSVKVVRTLRGVNAAPVLEAAVDILAKNMALMLPF